MIGIRGVSTINITVLLKDLLLLMLLSEKCRQMSEMFGLLGEVKNC